MTRYFMSIPEAVNLIIHAACMTKGKDVFILKMGEVVRIVELAERIIRLHGLRPYKDIEIKFTGIRPGEKLHEELYYDAETPLDTMHPSILQLRPADLEIDATGFWERLNALMENVADDPADMLRSLRHVIQPQPSDEVSVQ
jgi:FlaA1/EpsC-like NDP-sugar epimerase